MLLEQNGLGVVDDVRSEDSSNMAVAPRSSLSKNKNKNSTRKTTRVRIDRWGEEERQAGRRGEGGSFAVEEGTPWG